MNRSIHELAEQLERKRLTLFKLNLSGFVLAGITWLLNTYAFHSQHWIVWSLLGLGLALWSGTVVGLILIKGQVNASPELKQLFHDELSAYNRLKTWKAGFIALLITLVILQLVSLVVNIEARLVLDLSIFVAVSSVLAATIVLEEILAITVFQEEFDTERYEVWNWKHWAFFFWVLSPVVAFNELVLGQRIPKVMLIDKQSDKPLMEKQYVPCPHCNTLHDGRIWSGKNKTALSQWYGYYCPSCGGIIPCLQNITSYIILTITYPLRLPFLERSKRKWLAKQPARYVQVDLSELEFKKVNWLKMSFLFGAGMFVVMTFVFAITKYLTDEESGNLLAIILEPKFLLVNLGAWTIGGLIFGLAMKFLMGPKSPMMKSKPGKAA